LEQEPNESINGFNQSNDGFTSAGVIQLRLDTAPLLDNLEAYFRGSRIIGYEERLGAMVARYGTIGKPKLNEQGVQSLMSWLTPLLSPSTVQGNFKTYDDLQNFLCRLETDLYCYIMINLHKWQVSIYEIDGIVDMIINTCEPFFSRLLENKERESYGLTMVSKETRTQQTGGLKLFRS
jgi:hypothetical protein